MRLCSRHAPGCLDGFVGQPALELPELGVQTGLVDELLVAALLSDSSVLDHQYLVGRRSQLQAMTHLSVELFVVVMMGMGLKVKLNLNLNESIPTTP